MTLLLRAGSLDELRDVVARTDDSILVIDPTLVMHDTAFDLMRTSVTSRALVAPGDDVQIEQSFIVDARSSHHAVATTNAGFAGALLIAQIDRDMFLTALDELEALEWELNGDVSLLLVAAIRSGIAVSSQRVPELAWSFGDDSVRADWTDARVARARSLSVNRSRDGFYSTFVVRKLSTPLTRIAVKLGMSPNLITVISLVIALGSAVLFGAGAFWATVVAAIALQVSLVIDCVDGEVARATGKFSKVGAWLDASTDRVKEFAVYLGLAVGAWRLGTSAWVLAAAMVTLQTFRHMGDYDFQRALDLRTTAGQRREIADTAAGESQSGALFAWSSRANSRPAVMWAKRVIHLPIGERWLIISVAAIVFGPFGALVTLFIAQLLALAYVMSSRVMRTMRWKGSSPARELLEWQFDATLLAGMKRALIGGRFDWLAPATYRLFEMGSVVVLSIVAPNVAVVALVWLIVISYHHYDVLYRSLLGKQYPSWLTFSGLGWDGRTLLVVVMTAFLVMAWPLAIVLAFVLFWLVASAQWLRSMRTTA